jgi:uroporphyrinogen decarboxylase
MLQNDLILRVAKGEAVSRPPVWLMRQAGRFLREYRDVRAQAGSFRQMIARPEIAAEVTLQPVDILGVDAAIIFSDILVIPEAMGLPYEMAPGKGPFFQDTVRNATELKRLHKVSIDSNLNFTYEAIRLVKKELDGKVPLIGFAGAPWTIFSYMTEGQGSKTFSVPRALMYRDPVFTKALLDQITDATILYLKGQVAAGVDLIQIFDSWAGLLGPESFREFSLPYIKRICEALPEVPKIVFAKGASYSLKDLNALPCEVLGLDWTIPPDVAAQQAPSKAYQGNLDPGLMYAAPSVIERETEKMLNAFPAGKHIANLGHGIYPDFPREHVIAFVNYVKAFSYSS